MEFLSLRKGDFDLAEAALKINGKRNDRVVFFLDFAGEAFDFPLMQQKLSLSGFVVIKLVPLGVFGNVHVDDEGFVVFYAHEAVDDADFAGTDRFDFGPAQGDAGFKAIFNEVQMASLFVSCDDFHGDLLPRW